MPILPVRFKSWRMQGMQDFSGGITYTQTADNELELCENADVQRYGAFTNRLGVIKANSGSMGTAMIVGIGFPAAGNNVYTVVAKTGTTWYNVSPPTTAAMAYTAFTAAESPLDDPVRMDSALDASDNRLAVFTNKNFTRIHKWDGGAATATIAGSPAGAQYMRWHQKRLYAAGLVSAPNSLYFSEKGDVLTWPTTNVMLIPQIGGPITGLEAHSGRLYIFCQRAIYVLEGDPPEAGQYMVSIFHERIGCNHPLTLTTQGTSTAFMFDTDPMILSGSIRLLSEKTRGRGTNALGVTNGWAVLTPSHYVASLPSNTSSPPAVATPGPAQYYVFDRSRYQSWSDWIYPATTTAGATVPYQAVVAAVGDTGFFFGGGNGNLYFQPFRRMNDYAYGGDTILPMTQDSGTNAVTGLFRTKWFAYGDSASLKQVRRVRVGGSGLSVKVTLRVRDSVGVIRSIVLATGQTLPLRVSGPPADGATGYQNYTEFQFEVQGLDLAVTSLDWEYRISQFFCGAALS